jgi:CRP-like cAMP-binding protein
MPSQAGLTLPRSMPAPGRLEALPFFHDADPVLLGRLAPLATWRIYEPGAVILDFDDPPANVFFIASGTVRVLIRTPAGRELILSELQAGQSFGELGAIDGAPRTANVTAIQRSMVCSLPAAAFVQAVLEASLLCRRLLLALATRLRLLTERALEREALTVRLRLCAELLRLSRGRLPERGAVSERIVSPPPPQHDIAARIGARREVVSRELAELVRRGLVRKTPHGLVIPSAQALQAEIDAGLRPGPQHG